MKESPKQKKKSKANPTADDKKLIQNILYFSTTELNRNISIFENEKMNKNNYNKSNNNNNTTCSEFISDVHNTCKT
ncbi:hypothetical protein DERP_010183 [Dermatophagoides pteronyssinus]|uniref:Uncharacterized protein n=1 Tax=Dermatophagoides pteronyssinus TaxID=6956 RepID=A0ABQ8J7I3_DERPT|nr:hypothetical protein DERP_010183 [Dermatophagoides pteronyssinus]